MISESGESCFIISRIPEDETFHLITDIVSAASESGISLRALPISAYVGYRNNLYRRLWNSDGSWDADVSGLIDQVRLLPRES